MVNFDIKSFFEDIPLRITPSIAMDEVNQIINVYEGGFELKLDDRRIKLKGTITFNWFPHQELILVGVPEITAQNILEILISNRRLEVIIDGLKFGECLISHVSSKIEAIITTRYSIIGDKSIPVDSVNFIIPNLRLFLGDEVKDFKGNSSSRGRLIFENDKYNIIIDSHINYKDLFKALKSKGGYISLYSGELKKKMGNIQYEELKDVFYCFSKFLSFLNGRRCSALFLKGMHNDEEKWFDYTNYDTDQYKSVISWPQDNCTDGLNNLWQSFCELWKNEDDKDFLITVIHWYTEANSGSGHAQGSIIMTQTALELIYNWLLIEKRRMLIGKDSENISASNKIRLLLTQLDLGQEIPSAFNELKALPNIIDAPDAFVQIRNAIVHSQEEKRKKLSEMPPAAIFQARHLGIWYLELSLLYILKFKGKYSNRTLLNELSGPEVSVPWVKEA